MAKPGRNTIILGGLAVVAVLGWLAWDRLQPAGLPAGFASANGRIEATEVDIAALTGGRIAEITAAEGDMVSAGDVLVQMDVVQLNAQKRQAEAQLARAEIGVETARALVAQAEAQERAARAAVRATGVRRLMLTHLPAWNDPDVCRAQAETVWPGLVELGEPGAGPIVGKAMTAKAVSAALGRYLRAHGSDFTAHKLRARYLTRFLAATGDAVAAAQVAGHSDLSSITRYAVASSDTMRRGAEAAGRIG